MTGDDRLVVLEMTRMEAFHLAELITQFADLLTSSAGDDLASRDPAIARLVPDAYRDDQEAAREFRSLTQDDLLTRRHADARVTLDSLGPLPDITHLDEDTAMETLTIALGRSEVRAWLRVLAAVRLVLAVRLGITDEDEHDLDDPRFGIYDWLAFRLDGLVRAATGED